MELDIGETLFGEETHFLYFCGFTYFTYTIYTYYTFENTCFMAGHWLSNIILIVFDSTSTTREENLHICHNMGCWISYDVIVALLCSQICLATIYCWQTCFVAEWKKFCGCRMDFVGELCGETMPLCFYGGTLCGELCHCGWTPCAGELYVLVRQWRRKSRIIHD